MRFLADMGVSTGVVEWLRKHGHDAKHLREELRRMPNGEIFTKAIRENRIIITFDLDFGEIVALAKGKRASVILLRLHNTRTSHLLDRLSAVLKDSASALEEGAVELSRNPAIGCATFLLARKTDSERGQSGYVPHRQRLDNAFLPARLKPAKSYSRIVGSFRISTAREEIVF